MALAYCYWTVAVLFTSFSVQILSELFRLSHKSMRSVIDAASSLLPFISSVIGLKRLRKLEDEANRAPNEAARQLALMAACNQHGQSHVAVRRYESGNYATDDGVLRDAYLNSLRADYQINVPNEQGVYASLVGLIPDAAYIFPQFRKGL